MPSINLRLSDEEHDALRKWAFDSRRSLQKEIVWRLFSSVESTARSRLPGGLVLGNADAQPRDIPARTVRPSSGAGDSEVDQPQRSRRSVETPAPETHFKPDPK